MIRQTIVFLLFVLFAASASAQNWGTDGEIKPDAAGISLADSVDTAPVASASLKASAKRLQDRPGFTWQKRRALGLTIPNMIRTLGEMDAAGELTDVDQSEVAVGLMQRLRADKPQAYQAEAAIDPEFWARLLKFIQFILPLLLLFI